MTELFIEKTKETPEINFNYKTGVLKITGRAYSNDIYQLFKPLNSWLDEYITKPKDITTIELKIEYCSSIFNKLLILRYHQSTGFNCEKTIQALLDYVKYKEDNRNLQLTTNILEILNSGALYVHGRDCKYRPIIVMNMEIFYSLKDKYQASDFEATATKFNDYIVDNMLIPGQVENWCLIVYMGNASIFNLPDSVKKLFILVQNNYRCRLYKSFIVGLSSFMTFLWGIIKYILDPNTAKKFEILKDSELGQIQKLINGKQLEKKFGGEAPNVPNTNLLFPPREISNQYLLNTDIRERVLVSKEDYIKIITNNKLILESPYLKDEINFYKSKDLCIIVLDTLSMTNVANIIKNSPAPNHSKSSVGLKFISMESLKPKLNAADDSTNSNINKDSAININKEFKDSTVSMNKNVSNLSSQIKSDEKSIDNPDISFNSEVSVKFKNEPKTKNSELKNVANHDVS